MMAKSRVSASGLAAAGAVLCCLSGAAANGHAPRPVDDRVVIDPSKPVNTFIPDDTLGAAIDGVGRGDVARYLTPFNIEKMRSAGLKRLTYRTRTELGIAVWHFSEEGTWSDAAHRQGYWTTSDHPSREPRVTWAYNLPRRGDSVDNANNLGYSRIDDGDPKTFWKSNPYLDRRFTGAAESRPQYIVVSFDGAKRIDAARILWGTPFARHFLLQYWNGKDQFDRAGHWITFPSGDRTIAGAPDEKIVRLSTSPISARFLRVLLLQSSETAPQGSTDIRDRLGYAVRELSFGHLRSDGTLADAVRHKRSRDGQTLIQVSSTDPWHRAVDKDRDTEQPSLDMVVKSGLTNGLPMMVPVGTFYDTPDNAAAEIRYIKRRGFLVHQVELGEEADGQFIDPEDYADLYLEFAKVVHGIDPKLSLGGPSMQGAMTDTWPDPESGHSWMGRFVARLKARGGMDEFNFFSFEHYPFDDVCYPMGETLRDETSLMDTLMKETAAAGVPKTIPWIITEYGLSPFSGREMSKIPSALFDADVVGHFLSLGGSAAYMYGYPPEQPANQDFPCAGYGNMMLFESDDDGRSRWAMPAFYAERMMTQDWAFPGDKPLKLYPARSQIVDSKGRQMVVAYPLQIGGATWAVMLINRDEQHAHRVSVTFGHGDAHDQVFGTGVSLQVVQYSSADYVWRVDGEAGHPIKDNPPERYTTKGEDSFLLPAMSLTVVRGALAAAK